MNSINFNQTGGFGLSTNILDAFQANVSILGALGAMAGDRTIISGCTVNGSTVSDGIVYLNGEVFEFKGGAPLASVKIYQTATQKVFENGELKDVLVSRYIGFGSGTGSMPWSDFVRIDTLKNLKSRILPPGTNPQLYSGAIADIPTGWQLCDGTNGTPDLKGRFIVGYDPDDDDYNTIGNTGGEKEHTLTVAEMPAHAHGGVSGYGGDHTHTGLTFEGSNNDNGDPGTLIVTSPSDSNGNQTQSGAKTGSSGDHRHTIASEGGGAAHENRPPYYTLAYIIYLG